MTPTGSRPPGRLERKSGWQELSVSRVLPEGERPTGYALDVVTGGKGNPNGFARDFGHSWIRLVEPTGEVISVGFFPDESTGVDPERIPGRRMPGMLCHPDKYDGLRYPSVTSRIPISQEQHGDLIAHIESLQAGRTTGSLAFCILDHSCVGFCVDIAAHIGVDIDARYDLVEAGLARLPSRLRRKRRPDATDEDWRSSSPAGRLAGPVYDRLFTLAVAISGGTRTLNEQWVADASGAPARQDIVGIEPVLSSWRAVTGPVPVFLHIRPLIRWQRRRAEQEPTDPNPPDGSEHDASHTGSHRQQHVASEQQT